MGILQLPLGFEYVLGGHALQFCMAGFGIALALICLYWSRSAEKLARRQARFFVALPAWLRQGQSEQEIYGSALLAIKVSAIGAGVAALICLVGSFFASGPLYVHF